MNWTQVLSVFAVVATNLAAVVVLYIHQDSKTLVVMATNFATVILLYVYQDSKMTAILKGIQEEMKDFHGRLCAIEERNKGK